MHNSSWFDVYQISDKVVWMLRFDPKRLQRFFRKIFYVCCYNQCCMTTDSRGNNVSVTRVWQCNAICKALISRYETIQHSPVHTISRSFEFGAI